MRIKFGKDGEKNRESKPAARQQVILIQLPQDTSFADRAFTADGEASNVSISEADKSFLVSMSQIATNAWRAKTRMIDPFTGEPRDEMKRVFRNIEAILESLKQIDIVIDDPMGHSYDSGMALNVISFERTPGISKEKITETIKPSVTWRGQLIQMGEVIVGTPQDDVISEGER